MKSVITVNLAELKSSLKFPDPLVPLEQGIVAIGGRLDVGTLYHAYRQGVFPWPQPGYPMLWFCPDERGVLKFQNYHQPQSFLRFKQKNKSIYRLSWNENFEAVIHQCQQQFRKDQNGTWILPALKKAYLQLHQVGLAHSIECWHGQELVGGLYGVYVHGVFSGESMFHTQDNTSKLCLDFLVEQLKSQGHEWIDIQMVTPVLKAFGGSYVSRDIYLQMLREAQSFRLADLEPRK